MTAKSTMSVAEALSKADQHANTHGDVPSVSRTLAAEVRRLEARVAVLESGQEWQPIMDAPKNRQLLMRTRAYEDSRLIICSGRYRYGYLGEPSQDTAAFRTDCCGRFGNLIEFTYMPEPPK